MNRKKLVLFLMLTLLATGFIFYNSVLNKEESGKASDVIEKLVEPIIEMISGEDEVDVQYIVRKGAHLTEFFVLGLLVMRVLNEISKSVEGLINIFGYGLFYVLAVAVTDEFIQGFSDRTSAVTDVLIDFTGGVSAFCTYLLFMCIFGNKSKNKCMMDGKEK